LCCRGFFFSQAEDGIRDRNVTGVQTCALPISAFVFLISLNLAPAWVVAIIVCRELAVTGLRLILAENKGQVLAAKMPGKIKTTTQMLSIIFLLLGDVYYIGTILLYICLIFTIYSGYDYFKQS